ncbi:MAG TPA: alpha/beta hydrolase [Acidimicrobiales bacterium]
MTDVSTPGRPSPALALDRIELEVNGTPTVVLVAGPAEGSPMVYFHGGGTFHGWEFARAWADDHRVLIPFHPGFGESGDLADLHDIGDYVLHYTALFDKLGLTEGVNLIGSSLGGLTAARFAIAQQHRLRRLVLVSPAGLRDDEHPGPDFFRILPEDLPGYLVHDMATIAPYLPTGHDVDFIVDRYRETRTMATLLWEHPFDRILPRWLGIVATPTLIVWGDEDRLIPPGQAQTWAALLPDGRVAMFPDAGHLVLDESPDAVAAVAAFCA